MSLRWFIVGLVILAAAAFAVYFATTGDNPDNNLILGTGENNNPEFSPVPNSDDNFPPSPENDVSGDRLKPANKPINSRLNNLKVVVWKSERRLELYSDGEIVRTYPVGLGFSPEGDKERQGDGKTPEGEFYVCVKNPNSRFYLSLGISYPNIEDADRGLNDGLINEDEHQSISYAIQHKRKPPWNTALGGEICIHGHGSGSDWTLGCVALDNEHIRELYDSIPVGTPVVINP